MPAPDPGLGTFVTPPPKEAGPYIVGEGFGSGPRKNMPTSTGTPMPDVEKHLTKLPPLQADEVQGAHIRKSSVRDEPSRVARMAEVKEERAHLRHIKAISKATAEYAGRPQKKAPNIQYIDLSDPQMFKQLTEAQKRNPGSPQLAGTLSEDGKNLTLALRHPPSGPTITSIDIGNDISADPGVRTKVDFVAYLEERVFGMEGDKVDKEIVMVIRICDDKLGPGGMYWDPKDVKLYYPQANDFAATKTFDQIHLIAARYGIMATTWWMW